MADGGGAAGNSRSSGALDGAFLLHLLRNPPQSRNRDPTQQHHHQQHQNPLDNPHLDPAVASVGSAYPSSSSSSVLLSPHETLAQRLSPPNWGPPGLPSLPHQNLSFLQNSTPPGANSHWRSLSGNITGSPIPRRAQGNCEVGSPVTLDRNHGNGISAGNHRNGSLQRAGMEWVKQKQQHQQHNVGERNGHGHGQPRESMGSRGERSFREEEAVGPGKGGLADVDELSELMKEAVMLGDENSESSMVKRSGSSRAKEARIDLFRGHYVSSQRVRLRRREMECRYDIDSLSPLFLSIYKSLIPAQEETEKQKELLLSLRELVKKEWPDAQLHLYGSCASSFGVSNSDIDICLAIDDSNLSKSDILLKLADILQSDNLQNVQALTHARVPIVKMMDPVTGISCDICINNLLAVANSKLLRDYAQIDERLRQLAFIVKHWAKSRGVNETYRGTLSSYAYVIMCIHYLQLCRPAILPCLQEMEPTYAVTIDGNRYAYFDQVDRLRYFSARNNESIARLLWGFFHYWAYNHDYMNDVISIRTGRIISKRMKDWTRRIGNDRHLICIEDPFETSHDLGRVVDKFSIKILREELERAADILQYDRNPSITLFEPYVPRSVPDGLQLD